MAVHFSLRAVGTALLSLLLAAAARSAPETRTLRDLPYVTRGGTEQQLDLYLPATTVPPRPLVVWIHGGAWLGLNKSIYSGNLVAKGYAVASLNYRLSQEAVFPAQIEDCKAAVRWLRAHAVEYDIDPTRIAAWGESAGGHLAALLGVTGHTRQFDVGENLSQSSAVRCVVDLYGPTDFLRWGNPPFTEDRDTLQVVEQLIGGSIGTHQAAARAASPVYYVDHDSAPFLIIHGDKDPLVPLQQSQILNTTLQKSGVESTLIVLAGAGHDGPQFHQPDTVKAMTHFVDQQLGMITPN